MNLQTLLPLEPATKQIDYGSQVLLLGSCFVENIGDKLSFYKYQNLQNPVGILFHILGIENLITRAINNIPYKEDELFSNGDSWFSFEAHSKMNSSDKEKMICHLNDALNKTSQQLKNASHIVITLGTSWVFREKKTDKRVVNCHKMPAAHFNKELLTVEEIKGSLERTIALIRSQSINASLIFTISPVRHLKNGMVANQRSKSHLIAALGEVLETSSKDQLHYFPSYELVMDELRDYRFYAKDMIHLNELGIAYIWEKFKFVWLSATTAKTMKEIETIQKGLLHRPLNELSEKHERFVKALDKKIMDLKKEYPFISFEL